MKNLILIKLGGSIITEKSSRKKVNLKAIKSLAKQISQAQKKTNDLLIIGHGQGSFAHVPAKKYRTKEGNINPQSPIGLAKVRQECIELNAIILNALIEAKIPAITFEPHASLITNNDKLASIYIEPYQIALDSNLVPVVYGDTIMDKAKGWTIMSGEQILNNLAAKLNRKNFKVKLIIEVGVTNGVYDQNGKTIPQITAKNYKNISKYLKGSNSTDVTGGMKHKVNEALNLAKEDIPTQIIDPNSLQSAILGDKTKGTLIK